ncbi:DNA mismatch repair endonuclease MutL [Persephonella atlantica]|uniref:DNA mismatch repair protein MutL n=1 Tax=Persephonella atlantica TaxID=2699429 RepID=A0ABS1GJJ0_9AQUI|nr:DNA mismatch repair endonuclease MutL [Persephonella atlantica]MBK3332991.1 DNA mismatch repair endonuclease MutL [Persephonella atlantica]
MRIKKLPEDVINKIAAGEVVERPASVLKELIENSIDADADRIEIRIERGGKRLIEVKDNGRGIHPDDILEAVRRFSTSKIYTIDDLFSVSSYGFRGEALSSISSVSRFYLISRHKDFTLGKELLIEGGEFRHFSDVGAHQGTTVRVRDLFFNLPVRERFLKTEKTELKHTTDVFIRYALYHTDISFRFSADGKVQYVLSPEETESRIKRLFPAVKELIYFESEDKVGRCYGYISPDYATGRGYIYVNGRPVKNKSLMRVIRSKVGNNFFTLFLELPPYFVDHNIHPAKIEVKFRKERSVYQLVKKSLENLQKPTIVSHLSQKNRRYNSEFKVLGQIDNTFIVVYCCGDVYFVDQHIASERIHYELLKRKFLSEGISPSGSSSVEIKLDPDQIEKLSQLKYHIEKAGVRFDIKGNSIVITGLPPNIKEHKVRDFIISLSESEFPEAEIDTFIGDIACGESIDAGDILSSEEAKKILQLWIETDSPNLCPHGRPIYYKISVDDIKKKVGRK